MKLASLHHRSEIEPIWHVQMAVFAAIALQLLLSNKLSVGPKYFMAGFELLLVLALALLGPREKPSVYRVRRGLAVLLIALISFANITSLILVIDSLFSHNSDVTGKQLIISGLSIYLTNIIIFGLWYWELDRGNEYSSSNANERVDFLFPQMTADAKITKQKDWQPSFFDYLYVSTTNATAFSPTDALPLTHRAKLLMTLQSMTALLTIALVAARAVNILA